MIGGALSCKQNFSVVVKKSRVSKLRVAWLKIAVPLVQQLSFFQGSG